MTLIPEPEIMKCLQLSVVSTKHALRSYYIDLSYLG